MTTIRVATTADLDRLYAVEIEAWPREMRASREMLESRINVFPTGTLAAFQDSTCLGFVCTQLLHYDLHRPISTWNEATDGGFIKKSHRSNARTLFGINLSVRPCAPVNTSKQIMIAAGQLAVGLNVKHIVLGARIPRYHKFAGRMSAEEYVTAQRKGRPLDPELAFYVRAGMKLGPVLADYFADYQSLNYGVLVYWRNPFYQLPCRRLWVIALPYFVYNSRAT